METEMRDPENISDIRPITDAELDNVNGGSAAVPFVFAGLFLLGAAIGDCFEPDFGVQMPSSLDALYASW
jgi:hypothetical protein